MSCLTDKQTNRLKFKCSNDEFTDLDKLQLCICQHYPIQVKSLHFFDEGFNSGKTQDFSEIFIFKFLLKKISTLLHELEEDSIGR
jgi:hypothetical protein